MIRAAEKHQQTISDHDWLTQLPVAPRVTLLGDRTAHLADLAADLGAIGLRCDAPCGLERLIEGEALPLGDLLLIDVAVVDSAMMAALTRLDDRLAHRSAAIVVATGINSLDALFGVMSVSSPEILVSPGRADWLMASARALARLPGRRLRELDDADRVLLLRMTEQMEQLARQMDGFQTLGLPSDFGTIKGDVADDPAFRFESPKSGWRGPRRSSAADIGDTLVDRGASVFKLPDAKRLRSVLRHRHQRNRVLGAALFADPAWDMLLDLAVNEADGRRVSVTSLCLASGVPPTTALRWLSMLVDAGLAERQSDPSDRRRAFISLTDASRQGLRRWFAELDDVAGV